MTGLWRRLLRGSSGLPEPPPFVRQAFEPATPLERALASGDAGAIRTELLQARLFVPSRGDATLQDPGDAFVPVLLETDVGPCVAACTSADRLHALLPAVADVASGIEVDAAWVLAQCPERVGLAINPGWREGVVLAAAEVARLRAG